MYILEEVKEWISSIINEALDKDEIRPESLVYPPNPDMGDLCLPCFDLGKTFRKNPARVALELAEKIKEIKEEEVISGIKAEGPYLNIFLNIKYLARKELSAILKEKEEYGKNDSGEKQRVVIEYSNVNTHKEYHVGHLRNICYGDSMNKIFRANGYKSIPVSYVNDFGIHVAKTLWAYLKFYKEEPKIEKGKFLGTVYVRATEEMKKSEENKKEVSELMKKIESREGEEYELWEKTREWSISQFEKIYKELDIKFDHFLYENEFIEEAEKQVALLLKKGILKMSNGAIIADLEKSNLGVLVIKRADGTALYPVADLSLAIEKFKKYKADISIYVVDIRQSLYFKQLFRLFELMGYEQKMIHLGHDYVKLPTGMMSSRSGNTIIYEDLRDKIFEKLVEETKERHHDWSSAEIKRVAHILTNGAMKFEMLKTSPDQTITFDIEKATEFNGFTAAYLQYTCARINSVFSKNKKKVNLFKKIDEEKLTDPREKNLILKIFRYPEAVRQAGEKFDPSEIAKYLFNLARNFNDYYHAVPVLKAKEEEKQARLILLSSINQIIKNGLELLGIKTVEKM